MIVPVSALTGQFDKDPGEDADLALPMPSVYRVLVRAVFHGRLTPAQTIAIDEDNSAEDASVIVSRTTSALGKERSKALHLRLREPKQITHVA